MSTTHQQGKLIPSGGTGQSLLDAQRTYQQARIALVIAQANRFADTVALFQALGGGWWNRSDVVAKDRGAAQQTDAAL